MSLSLRLWIYKVASLEELRASAKALLSSPIGQKPSTKNKRPVGDLPNLFANGYKGLVYEHKCFSVLYPVGFEWSDFIYSHYMDEGNLHIWNIGEDLHKGTHIVHGHGRDTTCFSQHQCHVLGYKPEGWEGENFFERWKKFGYV